jgi:protein phosphatase
MKLSAYGITDTGLMRSNNEDNFLCAEQSGLFIVADGMGGHAAGEVASQMAIDSVAKQLAEDLKQPQSPEQISTILASAIKTANQEVLQAAADNPQWSGMGTTLTLLLQNDKELYLAHVGDSRLYRWRDQQLEQLSDDQTLVAEQLRRGVLNQAEADQSNLRNILLQAIGAAETLDICQKSFSPANKDRYLLCSDGLTGMLSDQEISNILKANPALQRCAEQLLAAALAAGGADNITVVLVDINQNEKS